MPDVSRPIDVSRVSIFDLDRTITRHGTWSPFLLYVAKRRAPWRLACIPAVILAMASYKLGLISRARLKEYMHAAMIGRRIRKEKLSCLADQFAEHILETGIYPQALALMRAERHAGREVIIATAAHHFYAERLAERCGVESLVATQSRHKGDWLTSGIAGQNCYGAAKYAMLAEHFHKRGINRDTVHVRFYSDDLSDLPTFAWADEPIAVNPSRKLTEHAARNGWLILDWRQRAFRRNSPTRASLRPETAPIMPTSL